MSDYQKEIEKYKKNGVHFITPTPILKDISDLFVPVFDETFISHDPKNKEVYLPNSKEIRLSGKAIKALGISAGIIWNISESGTVKNDSSGVEFAVVGGIRRPDGTPSYIKSTYGLKISDIEDDLRNECFSEKAKKKWFSWSNNKNKKEQDWEIFSRENFNSRLRKKKYYIVQNAETGAKSRLTVELLGLKSSYTIEELKKPFVSIKIVFNQNNPDPVVKQAIVNANIQAIYGLYGAPPAQQQLSAPVPVIQESDYNEIPPEEQEEPEEPHLNPEKVDFANCDLEQQFDVLEKLAKKKGYDFDEYVKKLKNGLPGISQEKRDSFFEFLKSMTDI